MLSTFNEYLYSLDVGYPAELVNEVFTADAVLEVINFPPGSMKDLRFNGRAVRHARPARRALAR